MFEGTFDHEAVVMCWTEPSTIGIFSKGNKYTHMYCICLCMCVCE